MEDKGDWRLQTSAHLAKDWANPWSGATVQAGTRLTVVSVVQLTQKKQLSIPIPNATATFLNASSRAYECAKALRVAAGIDTTVKSEAFFASQSDALDYVERMMESIILAYSAIEAFAIETIPSDFIYSRHKSSQVVLEAANKQTIERKFNTEEKLTAVLPEVLGCASPKGKQGWESFKLLAKTRDRIIHMKTEDRKSSGPEMDTVWKAIVLTAAPHLTAKAVIDHFVKAMPERPKWHQRFMDPEG